MEYILGLPVALLALYCLVSFFVRVTVGITHRNRVFLVVGATLLTVTLYGGGSLALRYLSQLSGFVDVMFVLGLSHMWYTFMAMWSLALFPMTVLPIIVYEYYVQVRLTNPGLNAEAVSNIIKQARHVLILSFAGGFFISLAGIIKADSSGWGIFSLPVYLLSTVIAMAIWSLVRRIGSQKATSYSL